MSNRNIQLLNPINSNNYNWSTTNKRQPWLCNWWDRRHWSFTDRALWTESSRSSQKLCVKFVIRPFYLKRNVLMQKNVTALLRKTAEYCQVTHLVYMVIVPYPTIGPLLPTTGEGNVFTRVCGSVHNRPMDTWSLLILVGYSVTPWCGAVGTHPTGMLSCSQFFVNKSLLSYM